MAVQFVSTEGSMNEKFENQYTTKWQVTGTAPFGTIEAIAAVGVSTYDVYNIGSEYDTTALCKGRSAQPVPDDKGFIDLRQWEVTLSYGRVEYTFDNPLAEPVKVGVDFVVTDEPIDQDVNGRPIVNTAGEPFAEAVNRPAPQCTVTFTRNEATFNFLLSAYYTGAVNMSGWLGVPRGCAMMVKRSANQVYNQNIGYYYEVNYEFAVNITKGFKKRILNQGLRQLNFVPKGRYPCYDDDWNPVTSPVLLARDGSQAPKMATPIFLEFDVSNFVDFNVFGF